MELLPLLASPACWEAYYEYKARLAVSQNFLKDLRAFIDRQGYLPVCAGIAAGERFALPKKSVISKMSSQKKRTVYTYPHDENLVLKLLTWLMLREYDGLFCDGLWSFRPGRSAKDAVRRLVRTPGTHFAWAYKADVSNYFNSVPVERLTALLRDTLTADHALCDFLCRLLEEPEALEGGKPVTEQKGMMAGTPLSAFYANLYLGALDRAFCENGLPYARYSDDIITFAPTREAALARAAEIRAFLAENGLSMNPEKEEFFSPDEGWIFLGFRFSGGRVDLAPASLKKIKAKMRRKTRALQRWAKRGAHGGEKAARAFIRVFNAKLFDNPSDHELTWALWYFPVLTTDESLHEIDLYAQYCIRVLAAGCRTKARFNVRYEDLRAMGYRSLVHEYHAFRAQRQTDGQKP